MAGAGAIEKRADRAAGPLANPWALLALFVILALAFKVTSFGDPNRHTDETFYFLVGQRMHTGALPYVDVWDRKPLGLFLIYYLIAGVSTSVWTYQIAACLFGALTALVVALSVQPLVGWRGGLIGGMAYLLFACIFDGLCGQAPDFYNLPIALAALIVLGESEWLRRGIVRWPIFAAMILCGVAITIKHTALFESLFFGLYAFAALLRSPAPRARVAKVTATWMLAGALPTLLIAAFYWQIGHWAEFWHAMVSSNLAKAGEGGEINRAGLLIAQALAFVVLATWGLLRRDLDRSVRLFLAGWIAAATLALLAVPNFYTHYPLPLAAPLSIAAGLVFGRQKQWLILFVSFAAYGSLWYTFDQREWRRSSIESMVRMTDVIRRHDPGGGLLVFDAPVYLYATAHERFLSPLVFPPHLNHRIENNVSHLDTHAELDRILANGPGIIAIRQTPGNEPADMVARESVLDYARRNCAMLAIEPMRERIYVAPPVVLYGDCDAKKGNRLGIR